MSYLVFAIIGYLLNATSTLVDKALIDRDIPNPFVYTFYLGILSLIALLAIPLGVSLANISAVIFAFLSGLGFALAWLAYYTALKVDEASRVAPLVGTINPIFALLIGLIFLSQGLTANQPLAFTLLIAGAIILSYSGVIKSKLERQNLIYMIVAGCLFGLSGVLLRQAFLDSNFVTGLVISRVGVGVVALLLLIPTHLRQQILASRLTKHSLVNKTSFLLIAGQLAGGLGGLALAYAISLQNAAIVNATQGVQYVFILIVVTALSKKFQRLLDENMTKKVLAQKIIGSLTITAGLFVLASGE